MAPRKGKAEPEGPAWSPPPFYVARADLMLGHPEGGMPVPAYRAGDQVPLASVQDHQEWAALVELPGGWPEPPQDEAPPEGQPAEEADPADVPVADDDSAAAGKDGE